MKTRHEQFTWALSKEQLEVANQCPGFVERAAFAKRFDDEQEQTKRHLADRCYARLERLAIGRRVRAKLETNEQSLALEVSRIIEELEAE